MKPIKGRPPKRRPASTPNSGVGWSPTIAEHHLQQSGIPEEELLAARKKKQK